MKQAITLLTLTAGALFMGGELKAQWVDFNDETDTRMVITNVNDNDDSNAVDDMEKDFVVGDYNNDGFDDMIIVRKSPFSAPGAKTDLLMMNNGEGQLVDMTDTKAPEFLSDSTDARDAIKLDADGDGWMDLFIVNTFQDQPKIFMNLGEDEGGVWLGFEEQADRLPVLTIEFIQFCAANSGDLTGNGAPDIYMVNYSQTQMVFDVLFINDGNGNFTEEATSRMGNLRNSSFGTATELHDVDNDGDLDLIKCLGAGGGGVPPFNDQGLFTLFNNGDGTFTNFQEFPGPAPYMFTAADLDNDNDLDFYVVDDFDDYVNYTTAMNPDSDVTYDRQVVNSDRTDVWGGNVKMVDIDGDGDQDVTVASVDTDEPPCDTSENNGQPGGVRIFALFENEGTFGGEMVDPYDGITQPWNISNYDQDFIDINNDGLMDLILGVCDGYKVFMQKKVLSIDDILSDAITVSVYPNPSKGLLNIDISSLKGSKVTTVLYSATGRKVQSGAYNNLSSSSQIEMNIRAQTSTGIYFLKIATEHGVITKKIVIE